MTVQLTKRRGTPTVDRRKLTRRAQRLLDELGFGDHELSLLLTGDFEMQALNRTFRGKDRTTDVLAFAQREGLRAGLQPQVLGDVVISLAQAERQAARRGVAAWDELLVLLVHGVLHLLGYDHESDDPARARAMQREQNRLVAWLAGLERT